MVDRRALRELPWMVGGCAAAALVTVVFGWLIADLVRAGWARLSWSFLVDEPRDLGRAGGIAPILASTAVLVTIGLAGAVPVGVAGGAYLAGAGRPARGGRFLRSTLDVMAAMPSIVIGLFGAVFFAEVLGFGFSLLAGGLTLGLMVLPVVIRTTEVALSSLPAELVRDASALSLSRWTTLRHVLLPAAAPAIGAGIVIALGRALAETAALVFTSGYVDRWPTSVFDSGRALSVHVLDLAMNVPGGDASAHASALVLLLAVVTIELLAAAATHGRRRLRA